MSRLSAPFFALVAAFSVFGSRAQAACPNNRCQERGDVVFRDLGDFLRGLFDEHSGVYMSYTGYGSPTNFSNHSVMEMEGPGGVRVIPLQRFVDDASTSLGYEGAHTAKDFVVPTSVRDAIAEFANLHRDLAYVAGSGEQGVAASMIIRYTGEPPLAPGQIEGIRSDGWVEYVYARAGIQIQGDIIGNPDYYNRTFTLLGRTLTELSPKSQRLAMEPTTVGDPSRVGRLRSPTHAPNNTCQKSPLRVQWDAATDALSGVAQYFARVDKSAMTIPDETDLPAVVGTAIEKEFILLSGKDYQVHVRSVDRAGNWDAFGEGGQLVTEHQGPFCIDNDKATVKVFDASGIQLANGGITSGNVTVAVNDRVGTGDAAEAFSGPGRLEIWKSDLNSDGTLLASNDDDFGEQHTYTSADAGLSVLGNLPEGHIGVKAFDRAKNEATRVSFSVNFPPRLSRIDQFISNPEGPYEGAANTAATAPILRAPFQTFMFDRLGPVAHTFKIYSTPDFQTVISSQDFAVYTQVGQVRVKLPDSDFYAAAIVDATGLSTTYYFKLDNTAPHLRVATLSVAPNQTGTTPLLGIAGTASDAVTGIKFIRLAEGRFDHDASGNLTGTTPGDVDAGTITATANLIPGAKTATFAFSDLPPGTPFTLGSRDMTDFLGTPPIMAGLDVRSRAATLSVPREVRGTASALLAYGGRGVGTLLQSVSLTTRKDFPTQTGSIGVYLTSASDTLSDGFFGQTLANALPSVGRTLLGTISGDNSLTLTPNLLGRDDFVLELEGPDLGPGEVGSAPTLVAFSAVGNTYGLQVSPPFLPLESNGTLVPVPAGNNIDLVFDNIAVHIESVTAPGAVALRTKPYALGTGVQVMGGIAAELSISAVYEGLLRLSVTIPEATIPGGIAANVRISQHETKNIFRVYHPSVEELADGLVRLVFDVLGNSDFALVIRPDGSPVPDFDATAPAPALAFQGGSYATPAGTVYVSEDTRMVLSATDDFSGVEQQLYKVDPSETLLSQLVTPANENQFNEYGASFTMDEGTRTLAWSASDRARNFGTLQSMPISVDGTGPTSSLSISGPIVVESSRVIVGPQTFF